MNALCRTASRLTPPKIEQWKRGQRLCSSWRIEKGAACWQLRAGRRHIAVSKDDIFFASEGSFILVATDRKSPNLTLNSFSAGGFLSAKISGRHISRWTIHVHFLKAFGRGQSRETDLFTVWVFSFCRCGSTCRCATGSPGVLSRSSQLRCRSCELLLSETKDRSDHTFEQVPSTRCSPLGRERSLAFSTFDMQGH